MQEWEKYKEVEIQQGQLVDRIKNKSQDDWLKVCKKLGLNINLSFGDGSHVAVYKDNCPPEKRECCVATFPKKIYRQIQRDLFKKVLKYGLESGKYTEQDIWNAFKIN